MGQLGALQYFHYVRELGILCENLASRSKKLYKVSKNIIEKEYNKVKSA